VRGAGSNARPYRDIALLHLKLRLSFIQQSAAKAKYSP